MNEMIRTKPKPMSMGERDSKQREREVGGWDEAGWWGEERREGERKE